MKSVSIIGSGFWGTAISLTITENIIKSKEYRKRVLIWTFEEIIDRIRITKEINKKRTNNTYLPNVKLSDILFSTEHMYEAVSDSDIIFFTVPVRYIKYVCKQMYISKPKNAHLICSCKGFVYDEDDQQLLTPGQFLSKKLSIDYSVFFMNNIIFSADNRTQGNLILNGNYKHTIIDLLRNKNVQVNLNIDKVTIEVILSLKSLVVIAMGLIDGLNLGFIFKLTLMEIALLDIIRFCLYYFPNIDFRILKDASGYNDALKRSFAGRNYICSLRMARDDTTANDVEKLLNGQTMHGYDIANSVGEFLILKGNIKEFPFFKTIYEVVIGKKPAYDIKKLLGKNV